MAEKTTTKQKSDFNKMRTYLEENIKLIGVLRKMSIDIDSVTDIDFNDALKALVNG